ncbi:hypothetical protein AN958_10653 [Leucoagaricus sp. SymC.cos]|nr:hypothetical protein AN958_10653 [Leucoagaricus sp. SymC.cos]
MSESSQYIHNLKNRPWDENIKVELETEMSSPTPSQGGDTEMAGPSTPCASVLPAGPPDPVTPIPCKGKGKKKHSSVVAELMPHPTHLASSASCLSTSAPPVSPSLVTGGLSPGSVLGSCCTHVWRFCLKDCNRLHEHFGGPWGVYKDNKHMFSITDSDGMEYVDDNLTDDEFDTLCGLYVTFTENRRQTSKLSWYPLAPVFDGQGEDMGWWTDYAEALWNAYNVSILANSSKSKFSLPINIIKWCNRLHGYGDGQQVAKKLEALSRKFLEQHVGQL